MLATLTSLAAPAKDIFIFELRGVTRMGQALKHLQGREKHHIVFRSSALL
jgi:hypothetical protein